MPAPFVAFVPPPQIQRGWAGPVARPFYNAGKLFPGESLAVAHLRSFRNTDPPRLVEVWNQAFPGRGAVHLRNSTPLERFVLAKLYFDPAGLILAEDAGRCVGFVHSAVVDPGQGPKQGVICMLGILPSHRGRGIGRELLRRTEQHLLERGAEIFLAGGYDRSNPFYFGVYGGANCPGFLQSNPEAEAFFVKHGYRTQQTVLILQRQLDVPLRVSDPRFGALRNQYQIAMRSPRRLKDWWQECTVGVVEPLEFVLTDRAGAVKARALAWEMEGFSARWGWPAVGVIDFEVDPPERRLGLGKYLLSAILKQLQEQYFQTVEVQIDEANKSAINFLSPLGFEQVDLGRVFAKDVPKS
ncbi:MAG: GNAT family N-acetyltransferase [Gemmataceae bacterium]|nr:GNAT family N-acetyltransferase [Gemmataceae bacterium]